MPRGASTSARGRSAVVVRGAGRSCGRSVSRRRAGDKTRGVPCANEFYHRHPEIFLRFRDIVDRVPSVVRHLSSHRLVDGVETALSIGAGDGAIEIELAARYGIRLTVIEPEEAYRAAFLAALSARGLASRLVACH